MKKLDYQKKIGIYSIHKLIGQGAFSSVFKGTNTLTNETVAIKMISINEMDSHKLESIEREIIILKSLNHPNIVSIKDFKKTKNNIYLIFEYCSKGNLETYLNKIYKKNIPETIVKEIINQLAKALKELKDKKIVHRDLKLANILISDDNKIKLSDFGFAKILENKFDLLQSYCGTPMTMAPEILNKGFYNEKCDIWSIGIIVYKMLTGNYPFKEKANNMNDFVNIVNKIEITFPKDIIISENAKILIRKMLVVDYEKRMDFNEFFNNEWVFDKNMEIEKKIEINNDNEILKKNIKTSESKALNESDIKNNEEIKYADTINVSEFCDIDNISLKDSFDFNENLINIYFLANELKEIIIYFSDILIIIIEKIELFNLENESNNNNFLIKSFLKEKLLDFIFKKINIKNKNDQNHCFSIDEIFGNLKNLQIIKNKTKEINSDLGKFVSNLKFLEIYNIKDLLYFSLLEITEKRLINEIISKEKSNFSDLILMIDLILEKEFYFEIDISSLSIKFDNNDLKSLLNKEMSLDIKKINSSSKLQINKIFDESKNFQNENQLLEISDLLKLKDVK